MRVDDDDANTCDDQGNYADRRGGHLSRDGEAMLVCLHVCIHIETYRASWSVVHVTTNMCISHRLDTLLRLRLCYLHIIAWAHV